jgi:hypothetical protein
MHTVGTGVAPTTRADLLDGIFKLDYLRVPTSLSNTRANLLAENTTDMNRQDGIAVVCSAATAGTQNRSDALDKNMTLKVSLR